MEKLNSFIENQKNIVKNLIKDAEKFYKENVKDDELKKIYTWWWTEDKSKWPPIIKYNRKNIESWLDRDDNIDPSFLNEYKDNTSIMAYLHLTHIRRGIY